MQLVGYLTGEYYDGYPVFLSIESLQIGILMCLV